MEQVARQSDYALSQELSHHVNEGESVKFRRADEQWTRRRLTAGPLHRGPRW